MKLKDKYGRIIVFFDKYYFLLMFPMAAFVMKLNWHGQSMQGIIPNYLDLKRIILSGFDPSAGKYGTPTFPMWGYGWVFLITENKLLILLFQNVLAIFSAWFFIKYLEVNDILVKKGVMILKLLVVVSLPWYAFNSIMWPYSLAVSLFLISFALLVDYFSSENNKIIKVLLSGILFGLMLNFRSDYYLMPIGIAVIIILFRRFEIWATKGALLWMMSTYFLLLPWSLYSKHATGHYLFTSTNGGHVLFIGLGNLPNNKWGITPYDEDPLMRKLIEGKFGKGHSTLVYDSDQFLRHKFRDMVKEDPGEYLRKAIYSFRSMITHGVYPGRFFESPDCHPNCWKNFSKGKRMPTLVFAFVTEPGNYLKANSVRDLFIFVLQIFSLLFGVAVVFFSSLLFPLTTVVTFRRKNLFFILLLSCIAYQGAINVFAYHMALYTANMYFFHLVNLTFGLVLLKEYVLRRLTSSEGIA
jgi:hypothetical protein